MEHVLQPVGILSDTVSACPLVVKPKTRSISGHGSSATLMIESSQRHHSQGVAQIRASAYHRHCHI